MSDHEADPLREIDAFLNTTPAGEILRGMATDDPFDDDILARLYAVTRTEGVPSPAGDYTDRRYQRGADHVFERIGADRSQVSISFFTSPKEARDRAGLVRAVMRTHTLQGQSFTIVSHEVFVDGRIRRTSLPEYVPDQVPTPTTDWLDADGKLAFYASLADYR